MALVSGQDTLEYHLDIIWWVKVAVQYAMALAVIRIHHSQSSQVKDVDLDEDVVVQANEDVLNEVIVIKANSDDLNEGVVVQAKVDNLDE